MRISIKSQQKIHFICLFKSISLPSCTLLPSPLSPVETNEMESWLCGSLEWLIPLNKQRALRKETRNKEKSSCSGKDRDREQTDSKRMFYEWFTKILEEVASRTLRKETGGAAWCVRSINHLLTSAVLRGILRFSSCRLIHGTQLLRPVPVFCHPSSTGPLAPLSAHLLLRWEVAYTPLRLDGHNMAALTSPFTIWRADKGRCHLKWVETKWTWWRKMRGAWAWKGG